MRWSTFAPLSTSRLMMRTRAFQFPDLKKNGRVEIQHTLLGVELKVSNRRLFCPDLATARVNLATCLKALGRTAEAKRELERHGASGSVSSGPDLPAPGR